MFGLDVSAHQNQNPDEGHHQPELEVDQTELEAAELVRTRIPSSLRKRNNKEREQRKVLTAGRA